MKFYFIKSWGYVYFIDSREKEDCKEDNNTNNKYSGISPSYSYKRSNNLI